MIDFLKQAAQVVPSERQKKWFDLEMYAFIHFGVNTFTGREWGTGTEDERIFNPQKLDCDQWVKAVKSAGCKGLVLTAKHHDGFCLWPSKYTEHSVKNSLFNGDVVKLAAEACKRGGIKFGFYLSPWDMNSEYYGTSAYNDYFCNQLTELLTEYGDIFYVWFDGACGEGEDGKKQVYDFERYFSLIRKYQPNAVIFNDHGPDIRWCGNEAGQARYAEWAVVPSELCGYADVQTDKGPLCNEGDLSFLYNTDDDVGSLCNILYSKGLVFCPSEIDMSIRKGWFWNEKDEPHSLERLFDTYLNSVGANTSLHLNVPPNKDGLIDEKDVKRLRELGEKIEFEFGNQTVCELEKIGGTRTQPVYEIKIDCQKDIKYIILQEDLSVGQRVENFAIYHKSYSGEEFPIFQGRCIGHKKICKLNNPFMLQNPLLENVGKKSEKLVLRIKAARDEVVINKVIVC
ncbi:alpha-L-fucosidase [Paludicola sp. MB14-C6]|uniref:alpha-L-fucosidase n=1 Tax=Paludihabitans sp. MB14-C6 TaxID=3070656 RepID=UPI0027DC905B|nr:alpha-L-fucosidase [Paludicola sp. MB14-C6]WMJ22339.1 alpha-L-fucosidase [Paludicola sp. MB14-C6]